MLRAAYSRYDLLFKEAAVTSRAVMHEKETYFIKIWHDASPDIYGIGECGLFRGLSYDDRFDYVDVLGALCRNINDYVNEIPDALRQYPSIVFGLETALRDLENGGVRKVFENDWSEGESSITINGLIWMGDRQQMLKRIATKLDAGFRCLKFKIGGIDFEDEVELIKSIRKRFSSSELEIRLDANGGFSPDETLGKLRILSEFQIHSIEQPIKAGQWNEMAAICHESPIAIALDEELIGLNDISVMSEMLQTVKPSYIILKPSLCGGFSGSERWIESAMQNGIGWWATSALESNIGLNAIAQWVSTKKTCMPQGLGTGALYTNNIHSPIRQTGECLNYDVNGSWDIPELRWIS